MTKKEYQYRNIIESKLGFSTISTIDYIKEVQCSNCKNKHCLMVIKDNKCINHLEVKNERVC